MGGVLYFPKLASRIEKVASLISEGDCINSDKYKTFLRAYVACLSESDFTYFVISYLNKPCEIRRSLYNRIDKIKYGKDLRIKQSYIDDIIIKLFNIKFRGRGFEAFLAYLYDYSNPINKKYILDHWLDIGDKVSRRRWLSVLSRDKFMFSFDEVYEYWHKSGDMRAIGVIAKNAKADLIYSIVDEVIDVCQKEDWVYVKNTIMRLDDISKELWKKILLKFPVTYAYLHLRIRRVLQRTMLNTY